MGLCFGNADSNQIKIIDLEQYLDTFMQSVKAIKEGVETCKSHGFIYLKYMSNLGFQVPFEMG